MPAANSAALLEQLTALLGSEIVRADATALEAYSRDATPLFHGLPEVIVSPRNTQEVAKVVKFAADTKTPIIARGAGSNLCGATIPLAGGIVLSMANMKKIIEISKSEALAVVQPGVTNIELDEAAAKDGLRFIPVWLRRIRRHPLLSDHRFEEFHLCPEQPQGPTHNSLWFHT